MSRRTIGDGTTTAAVTNLATGPRSRKDPLMKSFGTSRPWPPDLGAELRQLFSDLKSRHFRGDRLDRHPDLKTMLDELDVWLADTRDYQQWLARASGNR